VATRSGFVSIVVVPRACSIVIGVNPDDPEEASVESPASAEHPARPRARADAALIASRRVVRGMGVLPGRVQGPGSTLREGVLGSTPRRRGARDRSDPWSALGEPYLSSGPAAIGKPVVRRRVIVTLCCRGCRVDKGR
jgi:hypothetical protein